MDFPSTPVLDNFNRANGPLGANWTGYEFPGATIISNRVDSNASSTGGRAWTAATFGPDCESYLTVADNNGGTPTVAAGARLRQLGNLTTDGYIHQQVSGTSTIQRYDDGALTQIGASVTATFAAGDKIGITASSSTLTGYKNSGSIISRTDSTYSAAGYVSLECQQGSTAVDDFGGGSITGTMIPAPSTQPLTHPPFRRF
jgi:hypothetical protein